MSIVKKNAYTIGDNTTVSNLVSNVAQYNFDRTYITYSAPNILVKVGSEIECNGNLYVVETSDVSIVASVGNLAFNSATELFSISSSAYSYDPVKRGDYIDANTIVCRWNIGINSVISRRNPSFYATKPRSLFEYTFNKGDADNTTQWNILSSYVPNHGDKAQACGIIRAMARGEITRQIIIISYIEKSIVGSITNILIYGWGYLENISTLAKSSYGVKDDFVAYTPLSSLTEEYKLWLSVFKRFE